MSDTAARDTSDGPWHIHAVCLHGADPGVDGEAPRHWWVSDGRLTDRPVPGARDLPGQWLLPGGLVDAHVHLTMNFGKAMPHDDGSDELVAANGDAQRRAGVLALRDAGCAWGGVPRESVAGPRL